MPPASTGIRSSRVQEGESDADRSLIDLSALRRIRKHIGVLIFSDLRPTLWEAYIEQLDSGLNLSRFDDAITHMLTRIGRWLCVWIPFVWVITMPGAAKATSHSCPPSLDPNHRCFGQLNSDHLIIFIHGLTGDAEDTWTNTETQFYFPKEFSRDVADTYVVSFNYESLLRGGPTIPNIANELSSLISELLKLQQFRTLRFVAHSMGGIIAREYILRLHPRAHPQIKVTNLVSLSTPNNGSELAMFSFLIPSNRQMQELRHVDQGSDYLFSLNKEWNRQFKAEGHPRHLLLYTGYEELGTTVLGKIVKLSSAIVYADDYQGFEKNHTGIAKPLNSEDSVYKWVKESLQDSLDIRARQYLEGLVKQGLLKPEDILSRLPKTIELLQELQDLSSTNLKQVLQYIKEQKFDKAVTLLSESETQEERVVEEIAHRRFVAAEIHEVQFQTEQASQYYKKAVQLAPTNVFYRYRYGVFLNARGDARSAVQQLEEALNLGAAGIGGAALASGLGNAYHNLGQYSAAVKFHQRALIFHLEDGNLKGEGNALGNLGNAYHSLGQYTKAIELHKQALAVHRKIGDELGVGNALGNLGNVYSALGQHAKAIEFHEQALTIHRRIGDLLGEGNGLGSLGFEYYKSGQYTKALETGQQAVDMFRKIGNERGEGNALGNMGLTYAALQQYPKAIEFHEKALAVHRKVGNAQGEGNTLVNLGLVFRDLGQPSKAIEFYEQALTIHRRIGAVWGEGNDLGNLGRAHAMLGQYPKAIELFEQSQEIFEIRLKIPFPWKAALDELKNNR